jgi:ribonuclease HI
MERLATPTKVVDLTARGYVGKYGCPSAGWACILRHEKHAKCISGTELSKSEYRMELLAILNGLKRLKYPCRVRLHSGSEYICSSANQLIRRRRSSVFVSAVGAGTAKNADLWREFQALMATHWITIVWVRARSRDADDPSARTAARWAARKQTAPVISCEASGIR